MNERSSNELVEQCFSHLKNMGNDFNAVKGTMVMKKTILGPSAIVVVIGNLEARANNVLIDIK